MARQQPFLRFGEFQEYQCEVCGRPAFIRVAAEDGAPDAHYFCEEHLQEAQRLSEEIRQRE